ncbi:hypothetical protein Y032_0152g2878 [Ancylostoma ceylanicum]|uniref:Uncharacterized protein n=1 Tax=Ancylostoma ceylanicum TaxID=53326 RepID=A0A016T0S0_9BILA|nr:hypothetical protein Y032_0152g2878 [Ancylostoma ceylanicum]
MVGAAPLACARRAETSDRARNVRGRQTSLALNMGIDGGDPSAASKSTQRKRPARARILSRTTNYGILLMIRYCGDDSIVSGAVALRVFRGS